MKERGYFGQFGGAFLPEVLVATFEELGRHFSSIKNDPVFWDEYTSLMSSYSCRPTPLTFAQNLTRHLN